MEAAEKRFITERGVYMVGYVTYGNTSNTFYLLLDIADISAIS